MKSATLTRVLDGQLCSGCGLCASVSGGAVRMEAWAPGFSRPVQQAPLGAAAEHTIAQACPGAVVQAWSPEPRIDPYWGPYRTVATGHAADPAVRYQASSGGVLSALLIRALRSKLIDRVIQVGPDPDHPTRNVVVSSTSEDDILARAGSRYSSSSPLEDIDRQLSAGGALAFVGKPCDVSALRRLASIDRRVGEHVPLVLSFFCAGVPSYNAADKVLVGMGVNPDEVTAFRYRGNGWPGYATATLRDGRTAQMSYADSWGGTLSKEVQFRCKICPDGVGGAADVALGDAWYGDERGYPSFEAGEGRSLIMSRTEIGERLVQSAIEAGELIADPLDVGEIDRMQPGQTRRKRLVLARTAALKCTLQPVPRMDGLLVGRAAARARPAEQLRNFLGTARRILKRRY